MVCRTRCRNSWTVPDAAGASELRKIPNDQPGMSPMETGATRRRSATCLRWTGKLESFQARGARTLSLCVVVGEATEERHLGLTDSILPINPGPSTSICRCCSGKPPKMTRTAKRVKRKLKSFKTKGIDLSEAAYRVLRLPTVADKTFLVTIGDRSVTGLICRDQMVGPWQVPVADCAATANGYQGYTGEAMAVGERTPLAR